LRLGKARALKKRDNKKSYDFHRRGWLEMPPGNGRLLPAAMISELPRREQE